MSYKVFHCQLMVRYWTGCPKLCVQGSLKIDINRIKVTAVNTGMLPKQKDVLEWLGFERSWG